MQATQGHHVESACVTHAQADARASSCNNPPFSLCLSPIHAPQASLRASHPGVSGSSVAHLWSKSTTMTLKMTPWHIRCVSGVCAHPGLSPVGHKSTKNIQCGTSRSFSGLTNPQQTSSVAHPSVTKQNSSLTPVFLQSDMVGQKEFKSSQADLTYQVYHPYLYTICLSQSSSVAQLPHSTCLQTFSCGKSLGRSQRSDPSRSSASHATSIQSVSQSVSQSHYRQH